MLKKYYLGAFFWAPIPHKWYQNISEFAGVLIHIVYTCIFKFSEVLMCEFHYNYIKNKCGNNSRLLFRDTDN